MDVATKIDLKVQIFHASLVKQLHISKQHATEKLLKSIFDNKPD